MRGYKALALGFGLSVLGGCTTCNLPQNAARVVGDVLVAPYKVGEGLVKLNPVKGAVNAAADVADSTARTVLNQDYNRAPTEPSRTTEFIREDYPLAGKVLDVGAAVGGVYWAGQAASSIPRHINQAAGYIGGAQAVIETVVED